MFGLSLGVGEFWTLLVDPLVAYVVKLRIAGLPSAVEEGDRGRWLGLVVSATRYMLAAMQEFSIQFDILD